MSLVARSLERVLNLIGAKLGPVDRTAGPRRADEGRLA